MKYQDFSTYEKIISSPRAVKILFLSFTCEDIAISDILRYVTILAVSKMNKKSCVLCGNFFSIYKINRTLHGRLRIRILSSRAESISHSFASLTRERYFHHSKIKFVSPRGHVISSIYVACVCRRYNARSDWLIVTEL